MKGSPRRPVSPAIQETFIFITTLFISSVLWVACGSKTGSIQVGEDDIGGVVAGPNGPEAGVWVIAETHDLPTRFAKIVVTDDKGQYLIPDLPAANYSVWVRGYGLVDSPKKEAKPGNTLDLDAVVAPDE
ncbi:MAG TPA: carboxypeptidase-like regulatory domain-containing protein, partial [Chryseolinea sp.]